MLDLAKSFLFVPIYLTVFLCLGTFILHAIRGTFSFSLSVLSGFFTYHLLFCLVALPCILTQQTLSTLMWIWLPVLGIALVVSLYVCRHTLFSAIKKFFSAAGDCLRNHPASMILPILAMVAVLFILYVSVCSYYVGWDTAFYIRTTLHAVENDSMYTLDAVSGQTASILSLRYALSPFYMNSAIVCRLTGLHPLLVQNLTDGSVCVILAFAVIYRIGLLAFKNDPQKACVVMILAAVVHISHASLFSTSDFLLLRSYEAKAYCSNIILPFIGYILVQLWKAPDSRSLWSLLFLGAAASIPISMSSLLTVPVLVASGSLIWLFRRDWRSVRNTILCMIPNLLFLGAYLLESLDVLTIHIG